MKKSFLILVMILLLAFTTSAFATPDDDYRAEFSTLYIGNLSDQDVVYAAYYLRVYGWIQYLYGSSHQGQVRGGV